jgi:hypothetical protein
MILLSETANKIMNLYSHGGAPEEFKSAFDEWNENIGSYDDGNDLLKIVGNVKSRTLLPFTMCTSIFNKLLQLEYRVRSVLKWYGFILQFYGEPSDSVTGMRLIAEAEEQEKKGH